MYTRTVLTIAKIVTTCYVCGLLRKMYFKPRQASESSLRLSGTHTRRRYLEITRTLLQVVQNYYSKSSWHLQSYLRDLFPVRSFLLHVSITLVYGLSVRKISTRVGINKNRSLIVVNFVGLSDNFCCSQGRLFVDKWAGFRVRSVHRSRESRKLQTVWQRKKIGWKILPLRKNSRSRSES